MKSSYLLVIVAALSLGGFVHCGKQQEAEQKTAPPTANVADTIAAIPVDTTLEEIKPQVVSSADGKYTVQVSSWRTMRKAEKEAQRFREQGYDAYVQQAFLPDRQETWYRVRIGRYASADAAAQVAGEIRALLESGYWIDRVRQHASSN